MTPPQRFIGIDVSKRQLDIAQTPCGEFWSTTNDEAGIEELVKRLGCSRPALIVLEATGGYEFPLVAELAAAKLPFAVANPRQVRAFAKGVGYLEKTDKIDAAVMAHFAEVVGKWSQCLPARRTVAPLPQPWSAMASKRTSTCSSSLSLAWRRR